MRNTHIILLALCLLLLAGSALTAPGPSAPAARERAAIRDVQAALGLPLADRDGVCGPQTVAAARALAARLAALSAIHSAPAGVMEGPAPLKSPLKSEILKSEIP